MNKFYFVLYIMISTNMNNEHICYTLYMYITYYYHYNSYVTLAKNRAFIGTMMILDSNKNNNVF